MEAIGINEAKERLVKGLGGAVEVVDESDPHDVLYRIVFVPMALCSTLPVVELIIAVPEEGCYIWMADESISTFDLVGSGFGLKISQIIIDVLQFFELVTEDSRDDHEQISLDKSTTANSQTKTTKQKEKSP